MAHDAPCNEMHAADYERMARDEATNWWFSAKRRLAIQELERFRPLRGTVLDVGCGIGGTSNDLVNAGFGEWIGIEPSTVGLAFARQAQPGLPLATGVAEALPIADGAVECLVSMDVIEHLDDDVAGLREYLRVLRPDAPIAIAVPAYEWAFSDHDTRLGHRRRYSARTLRGAMESAGIRVDRVTYFHSWLLPAALLFRKTPLRRLVSAGGAEARSVRPRANAFIQRICDAERRLARIVPIPFGLSILAVGHRDPDR